MRVAALTMVRDEAVMLPRWLAHYGAEVGPEHLYVIDDNTGDGSTSGLDCSVIKVPDWGARNFEATRLGVVSGIASGLLQVYDAVLFADADEFLVADPRRYDRLTDLVSDNTADVIGAVALNVVHDVAREPTLDPARPILEQRSWAKFVPLMCKPSIKRVSAPWKAGSHGITVPYEIDPRLFLVHAKFAEVGHLQTVGDHRKALADSEGRAAATSWSMSGDDLVGLVHEITRDVDPRKVPVFKPPVRKLGQIVREADNGVFRAHGKRQVPAMETQPLVQVPPFLRGRV